MGWCDGTMLGQLGRGEDFQDRQWGTCKGYKVCGWLRDTRRVSVRSNGDVFRGVKDASGLLLLFASGEMMEFHLFSLLPGN